DAAALAADLRRHQSHQPLQGVVNRDFIERWRKWRKRRPHTLAILGMLSAVFSMLFLAGFSGFSSLRQQQRVAETALADGQDQMRKCRYSEAVHSFSRGLESTEYLLGQADLRLLLEAQLRLARRAEAADRLHVLVDRLRACYGIDSISGQVLHELETCCH